MLTCPKWDNMFSILQIRKMRFRYVGLPAQGHTSKKMVELRFEHSSISWEHWGLLNHCISEQYLKFKFLLLFGGCPWYSPQVLLKFLLLLNLHLVFHISSVFLLVFCALAFSLQLDCKHRKTRDYHSCIEFL